MLQVDSEMFEKLLHKLIVLIWQQEKISLN
jgi:hypothetical protein